MMVSVKNTTLCYLERDGKYLMLHRVKKKNDVNHDKWIGVGGKFEAGESPEDCMLREVFEETGLKVTSWRYCGIITFVFNRTESEYMHLFNCTDWQGDITEYDGCSEGTLEWVEKEAVPSLPIWDGDRIFLKLMETNCPFFSLKLEYCGDLLIRAVLNGKELSPDNDAVRQ